MNKFEQFVLSTEEEKLKLIKAENPEADDEQVKEHVETLNKFFEVISHSCMGIPKPTILKTVLIATNDTDINHEQLKAVQTSKPFAFGIYPDGIPDEAKMVMNRIMRDILRKLEEKED